MPNHIAARATALHIPQTVLLASCLKLGLYVRCGRLLVGCCCPVADIIVVGVMNKQERGANNTHTYTYTYKLHTSGHSHNIHINTYTEPPSHHLRPPRPSYSLHHPSPSSCSQHSNPHHPPASPPSFSLFPLRAKVSVVNCYCLR